LKLKYKNCRGDTYFIRKIEGKKGIRYVCSTKESDNDLTQLPKGFEIAENPNAKVVCRKKLQSLITKEEFIFADKLVSQLTTQDAVKLELKKKEIIIYATDPSRLMFLGMPSVNPDISSRDIFNKIAYFEAVLRFELFNLTERSFIAYRMTWRGDCDWMMLKKGKLNSLIKELAPHIGKDSFYELF